MVSIIVDIPVNKINKIYFKGKPAANSIAKKIGIYTLAVPISGCSKISALGNASIPQLIKKRLSAAVFSDCSK